ncbi:isopenicillin N synthase family oxygenase, partial [Bacteroidales bacterium AH-315-I05]|nr:isopenicillin N synthase family oxygenase [Bacteroidales bacterium AH-315-I05]
AFNMNNQTNFNEKEFWPRPGYEPFFRELCKANETIILPIMQGILRYLKCDPHCYDKKLTETNFGFRLNYYPAVDSEYRSTGAGRMLGHEDVDLFTILPSEDLDGLQALNRENMKWVRINAPKGSIVINTGDYMQRITNDRLPSTTHRVSSPKQKSKYSKTRVSFPMAVYVWEEEILNVLPELGKAKYPPVSAIEFHTKITSKYYGDEYAVNSIK